MRAWQWEVAVEAAQLVALIIGLVVIASLVRDGLRAVRSEVAQFGRDFHARQDATNEQLGKLSRPALPHRMPTPVTLDLTDKAGAEKPTLLMPKATMDEAVRRATPTPRSSKL